MSLQGVSPAALLDALPEATLVLTREGVICFANPRASEVLRVPRGEMAGRAITDFIDAPPSQFEAFSRLWSRSGNFLPSAFPIISGAREPVQYRCEGRRLSIVPPLLLLRIIPREGTVARFVLLNERIDALNKEIERRKRAENELIHQTELLRVTLSSIGDAVMTTDLDGRITFLNDVAERLTGWHTEECAGRHVDEAFVIVNEESREPVTSPVELALATEKVVGLANHTVLIRRDGSETAIEDSGAPIKNAAGTTLGVVLVFRDVSERREAQRSQEEASRRKDQFLAMLAHELRNPLAVIASNAEILRMSSSSTTALDGATVLKSASMLERHTRHLTRLVDDLLDVSRISSGKIALKQSLQNLDQVVWHAVDMVTHFAAQRDVRIVVTPCPAPILVDADFERLAQVFVNLLTNAVKFSSLGDTVWVETFAQETSAVISVTDPGEGIAPEMLHSIFDPFLQADHSLGRLHEGLGVGLTIAKSIAEMHGGSIRASSDGLGRGSRFVVTLPLPS